ncbi:MAG: hypothetical protein RLZZ04_755 [Cyanobacteriota bacterium]|jgi:hypothetical protein
MSYLKWNLDQENGIDLVDPTGDFYIIGDEGEIAEKFTNIDVFFEVLVEGANNIKIGKSVVIDPFIEPNEFHFDYQDRILQITYGRQQTTILNRNKFIQDVYQAVTQLLEILDQQSEKVQQPKRSLPKLRAYSV